MNHAADDGALPNTLLEVLARHAAERPEHTAYILLRDGEEEEARISFGELEQRVLESARQLAARVKRGARVLLLYPQGFEFIIAFFACQYAGLIPLPVSMPNPKRGVDLVGRIAADAEASHLLSTRDLLDQLGRALTKNPVLASLQCIATDVELREGCDDAGELPTINSSDLALLQYTSGSTGAPRGVTVTHRNLVSNQRDFQLGFGHDERTVLVSWLPMFHDMGLGTAMQAVWLGIPCVLMAPRAFLQKPVRWLRAISRYRGSFSGGPDFAFDLCMRRVEPEQRRELDLSCWPPFNGGEPIRAATLERFAATFAESGFRAGAFIPGYGLAEGTLYVAAKPLGEPPRVCRFSAAALERNEVVAAGDEPHRVHVGNGAPLPGTRIEIVDPETLQFCPRDRVGEIWVRGPGVAAGYWRRPEETQSTFGARTADGEGPFLRTGDLGFFYEGQLFIVGRRKDLIVCRGRNHYPQDIEATVSQCHPALAPLVCAAFSIDTEHGEQLALVQEVARTALKTLDADAALSAMRAAVSAHHGLSVHTIALVQPASLPRTTSGKIQRRASKAALAEQTLSLAATWHASERSALATAAPAALAAQPTTATPMSETPGGDTAVSAGALNQTAVAVGAELRAWLVR